MNSIVFGRDKGGMVGSLLLAWKISLSGIFIVLFPHYICNGLLFLFSVSWLHVNEFNSFGKIKGRDQMSTSCSEGISVRIFYCSVPTLHLLWSILFIFCVSTPEGMKSVLSELKNRNRKRFSIVKMASE